MKRNDGRGTVIQELRGIGMKREGMGGNTTAWVLRDDGADILLSDGDHRAPTRWNDPAVVSVELFDQDNKYGKGPYATYERTWPTMEEFFFGWWLTTDNRSLDLPRSLPIDDDELVADGFVSVD